MTSFDPQAIEEKIDRARIGAVTVQEGSGLNITQMAEVMEFAKLMALSGPAVPGYMRNNPGACLAICTRAVRWQFDPFFVAEKSFLAKLKGGEERIAFESQLIHAVIEARAPLQGRLRHEIIGEGDQRKCRVWGLFRGETKPHEFTGKTLAERIADIGFNEFGKLKGSPLWITKPDVQLFYDASRDWARMHAPEILGGVYTLDELPDAEPVDVSPAATARQSLTQRLQDAKLRDARGFDPAHINREAALAGGNVIEGRADAAAKTTGEENGETTERSDGATGGNDTATGRGDGGGEGGSDGLDQSASSGAGAEAGTTGGDNAGGDAETQRQEGGPKDAGPKRTRR